MTGAATRDPAGNGDVAAAGDAGLRLHDVTPPLTPPPSGWRTRTLIGTGVVAFLAGALFWHLVGFWSFLSGIVFNPQDGAITAIARPPTLQEAQRSTKAAGHLTTSDSEVATADQRSPAALVPSPNETLPPTGAATEILAELLQCSEAIKSPRTNEPAVVHACPPLRQRLPQGQASERANRQLDAHEAAHRLANGWQTGISPIETGSLPGRR